MLIVGYIFAILGGLIGLVIGVLLWRGQTKNPDGTKVPKYDAPSRKQGMIIAIISILSMIIWNAMMD